MTAAVQPVSFFRRRTPVVVAVALGFFGVIVAVGIIIRITDKLGGETVVEVPEGSELTIAEQRSARPVPAQPMFKPGLPLPRPKPVTLNIAPEPIAMKPGEPLSRLALVQDPVPIPGARSWSIETIGHRGEIHSLAYSPDGRWLASGGWDGKIILWDTRAERPIRVLLGHPAPVTSLAWSPEGKYLASTGLYEQRVRLWHAASGRPVRCFSTGYAFPDSLAWSPDGSTLLVGGKEGGIKVWNLQSAAPPRKIEQAGRTMSLAWCADGQMFASLKGGEQSKLMLWQFPSLELQKSVALPGSGQIAWSPDRKTIGIAAAVPLLFDLATEHVRSLGLPSSIRNVLSVAFSPQSSVVAFGGGYSEGDVAWYDVPAGRLITYERIPGALGIIALAWSPDGSALAAGDRAGAIYIKVGKSDWQSPETRPPLVPIAAFSPDGKAIAYLKAEEGHLLVSDLTAMKTPRAVGQFPGCWDNTAGLHWATAANRLALSVADDRGNHAYLWDMESGKRLADFPVSGDSIRLSPDGKMVATSRHASAAKVPMQLWGAATGQSLWQSEINGKGTDWSPDGLLLAAGNGNDVVICDPHKRQIVKNLSGLGEEVVAVAWSPAGNYLAAKAFSAKFCVWDVSSGDRVEEVTHVSLNEATAIQWLSDKRLVCAGFDHVSVWDLHPAACVADFIAGNRHREPAISPDGRYFAYAFSGAVRLHRLSDGRLVRTILALRGDEDALISPDGHYAGPPGVEKNFVFVVLTDSGEQVTLSPEEFSKKYGWKNDPSKVMLAEPPSGGQAGQTKKPEPPVKPAEK